MSHPLEQRLRQVRRRMRGLLAVHGLSCVVGCVLGAMILLGLADYFVRFRDPGIRLICTFGLLGLFGWTVWHFLIQSLTIPWHDADLARRLGRNFPSLGDSLPSAVEFLHQREDDPTAGSFALRRAVVVQTTADVEKVNLLDAVRVGPIRKAVAAASGIVCLAVGITLAAPTSTGVALSRLANPFGRTVWPQTTHLAVLQQGPAPPLRLSPGETFDIAIRDLSGGRLSEEIRIHYRFDSASGKPSEEVRVTHAFGRGRSTYRANIGGPFAFRLAEADRFLSEWCDVRVENQPSDADGELSAVPESVVVARLLDAPESDEEEVSADGEESLLAILLAQRRVERVAHGEVFERELIDARGVRLPSKATAFYRWRNDDGETVQEEGPVQHLGSRLRLRRENVTRSFAYRVEAGDDRQMPWIPVLVIPAPRVQRHETHVEPPKYTGLPTEQSDTLVRALVGSRVSISAEANRSLSAVTFCSDEGERIECLISGPDQRSFQIDFEVKRSSAYWFELADAEGLAGGGATRWDVRAVPDAAPSVAVEQPPGNVFVTAQATVPLRISVKDDLAVRRIDLSFSYDAADVELPQRMSLYTRNDDAQLPGDLATGDNQVVEYAWALRDLALLPGSQLAFHVLAGDDLPQVGRSETRRINIITPEELAERIANRQTLILNELARVLEMQRGCRTQTGEIEIRLREIPVLEQTDVDQLRGAELNQRQINRTLTASGEGVPMLVDGLLGDLDNNSIDNPDIRRRMEDILAALERLGREHLPRITLEMTSAIKGARIQIEQGAQADAEQDVAEPLASAGRHQDFVISALEQLLGRLAQWENYRQFHRRVARLVREQKELAAQTTSLAQQTLGKDMYDLTPRQVADLRIQARRQFELARSLDRVEDEMRRSVGEIESADPLAAETVADALAESRRKTVSATMHGAGEAINSNRMGQAIERQREVVAGLQRVLDILGNRREHELARLIRRLQQAEEQLDTLAQQQGELQGEMEKTAEEPREETRKEQLERLRAAQEKLQEETEKVTQELERLAANDVADSTKDAEKNMQAAGDEAKKGEAKSASEKADEARKKLEQAKDQVAEKRRQAEAELAFEQMARLEDGLKALRQRQQTVLEGTERLDGLREATGGLSEPRMLTLAGIAREQALLEDETTRRGEELSAAAVFSLVLSQIAADMAEARSLLEQQETGAAAQQAEASAIARLDQIIKALQPEEPEQDDSEENGGGGQGEGQTPPPSAPGDALKAMAELKLLKLMQIGVNQRTRILEEQFGPNDAPSEPAKIEYERLGREQGRLADLLLGLMQEAGDPENDPARLPELDPEGDGSISEEVP